jgi:hypothetical protein
MCGSVGMFACAMSAKPGSKNSSFLGVTNPRPAVICGWSSHTSIMPHKDLANRRAKELLEKLGSEALWKKVPLRATQQQERTNRRDGHKHWSAVLCTYRVYEPSHTENKQRQEGSRKEDKQRKSENRKENERDESKKKKYEWFFLRVPP